MDEYEDDDKEKFVCMNHGPASCRFEVTLKPDQTVDDVPCPICKKSDFVYTYTGEQPSNVKEIRTAEREARRTKMEDSLYGSPA